MNILCIGDVVGDIGKEYLKEKLPVIKKEYDIKFTIVNGENSNKQNGIDVSDAELLFEMGTDVITTGNHVYRKKGIYDYLNHEDRILRPANYPSSNPGKGFGIYTLSSGAEIAVINMMGNVFMRDNLENPFYKIEKILKQIHTKTIIVDFHAEATSEKIAFAASIDGRVTAVVGTHTHVQTSDERVLPNGTAFISDLGMTGPINSSLGVKLEPVIRGFKTSMPSHFEVADGECCVCGAVISIDRKTGLAKSISRIIL